MAHEIDSNAVLWANLQALMVKHYGKVNLSRLAEDCGFAQSTATRIKQQQTATGLDKVDLIAHKFNLAAWQLLVPGFDPGNPPVLQPLSETERRLYKVFKTTFAAMTEESTGKATKGN